MIVAHLYYMYVCENKTHSIQHIRGTRKWGWNKQNEYFNQIDISPVTFPFQRCLGLKTFFHNRDLIIKISEAETKKKKSPKHKGSRTFQKQNKNSFSPGGSQSFFLYFLIVSFLIVSLSAFVCARVAYYVKRCITLTDFIKYSVTRTKRFSLIAVILIHCTLFNIIASANTKQSATGCQPIHLTFFAPLNPSRPYLETKPLILCLLNYLYSKIDSFLKNFLIQYNLISNYSRTT